MTSEPPEQPSSPRLPPELRRAVPVTIAIGAVGLTLFLIGFALGALSGGAAVVVALGAGLVAVASLLAMVWMNRLKRP
jgi:hypothetical protein